MNFHSSLFSLTSLVSSGLLLASSSHHIEVSPIQDTVDRYTSFLESIEPTHHFSQAEAAYWIAEMESAISQSNEPILEQVGWEVIISLYNTQSDWTSSIAACEIAIDSAVSPEVLFDRLMDLLSIQAAAGDSQEAISPRTKTLIAVLSAYDTLWEAEDRSKAYARWDRYSGTAWEAVRDLRTTPRDQAVAIAERFLQRAADPGIDQNEHEMLGMNVRGVAGGLLWVNEPDRAMTFMRHQVGPPRCSSVTISVALSTMNFHGVGFHAQNSLLWMVRDDLSISDRLNLNCIHIQEVLLSDNDANPTSTANDRQIVGGVSVADLINLIEPDVSELMAKPSTGIAALSSVSDAATVRVGCDILERLYRMSGDESSASYYRFARHGR